MFLRAEGCRQKIHGLMLAKALIHNLDDDACDRCNRVIRLTKAFIRMCA
jgi:hypothetical protein